ncbi:hypothetical protein [Cochlodiniinecator piscidefendens]|uniref:hypothetical protein n=1 Tax=Cochlodiniinecator piscidefendens TaxID=2715756 RepID=UPI00140790B7|nr:hypothetical protein [Cochlodiniinecator piscidefendens]
MTTFARLLMLLFWAFFQFAICLMWGLTVFDEPGLAYEVFELPADLAGPPQGIALVCMVLMTVVMGVLGWTFLCMSRLLKPQPQRRFGYLAEHLRRASFGLAVFWVGSSFMFWVVPRLLLWNVSDGSFPVIEWTILEPDLILLIFSIVFLALSASLRSAQEIEDDNKRIV